MSSPFQKILCRTGLAAALLLAVAACGETKSDRALSGAGIGAGIGAAGSIATGGSVGKGVLLGAGAGAAAGALTDKEDVDLGRPAWRR